MGSKTLKLQSIQQPEPTMTNDSQSELEAANAKNAKLQARIRELEANERERETLRSNQPTLTEGTGNGSISPLHLSSQVSYNESPLDESKDEKVPQSTSNGPYNLTVTPTRDTLCEIPKIIFSGLTGKQLKRDRRRLERRRAEIFDQLEDIEEIEEIHQEQFKTSRDVLKFWYPESSERELLLKASNYRKQNARHGIIATVIGQMQSGKTGFMLALIKEWLRSDPNRDPDHIFLWTSLPDKELDDQWKKRTPSILHKNMKKGPQINSLGEKMRGIKNALFIVDECHFGAKHDQVLVKFLKKTTILRNFKYLKENNIKMCFLSATLDGVLFDSKKWDFYHENFILHPGIGYRGVKHLLDAGQVKESWSLTTEPGINNLFRILEIHHESQLMNGCFRHVIRFPSHKKGVYEKSLNILKSLVGESQFEWDIIETNSEAKGLPDFEVQPSRPTLVLIKERLRAGKTICKRYVGVWFDRKNQTGTLPTTTVQGLLGRACGYDFFPKHACIYTYVRQAKDFLKYCAGDNTVNWPSHTTKVVGKVTVSKNITYQDTDYIKNLEPTLPADRNQAPQTGKYYVMGKQQFVEELLNRSQTYINDAIDQITNMKELRKWVVRATILKKLVEKYERDGLLTREEKPITVHNICGSLQSLMENVKTTNDETTPGLLMKQDGSNSTVYLRYNDETRD